MKNVKRLLSIVLSLAMLLTMVSFPAFAADDTYTPNGDVTITNGWNYSGKEVALQLSKHTNRRAGISLIARPTEDLYVGDTLYIPEGLTYGAPVKWEGYVLYGFSFNYTKEGNAPEQVRTHIRIDPETGAVSGLFTTKEATEKTKITFTEPGKYVFTLDSMYDFTLEDVSTKKLWYANWGKPATESNQSHVRFVIEVKPAPTSADYEVEVPAKLPGIAGKATDILSTFDLNVTESADKNVAYFTNFLASNNNGVSVAETKSTLATSVGCDLKDLTMAFTTKTYVKDFTIKLNGEPSYIRYDLWGSIDGTDWYKIAIDKTLENAKTASVVEVDAVVKYLRMDIRDIYNHWGTFGTATLSSVNAYENVPEAWNVTVDGLVEDELTTDVNGKVDLSKLLEQFPAGKFAYTVDGLDITDEIVEGTYRANGDVTITIGWNYPEKEIGVLLSKNFKNHGGPLFLGRPGGIVYVGDTLVVKEGTSFGAPFVLASNTITKFSLTYAMANEAFTTVYATIDAETGAVSGFYSDLDCTTPATITFDAPGRWFFAVDNWYTADGTNKTGNTNYAHDHSHANSQDKTRFFVNVLPAPTSADYEVEVPAKLPGIAGKATDILFTFDLTVAESTTKNVFYVLDVDPTPLAGATDNSVGPLVFTESKNVSGAAVNSYADSVNLEFCTKTYVKDFKLRSTEGHVANNIVYDVYGSLNGTDWYLINNDVVSTGTANHVVSVDAVVKYIRLEVRDIADHWGKVYWALSAINGFENVPDAWSVTFTDGTNTETVTTDANGFYTVPEEFKGDVEYYSDSTYTTKLNTAIPAKGNITVYVKANTWTYTPKTVNFFIKNTPNGVKFGTYFNGPIVAPRDTIYVGDTIVLPHEEYKNLTSGISGAQEIVSLSCCIERYGSKEGDNGKSNDLGSMVDVKFTVTEPGVYNFRVSEYTYLDAEGNTKSGSGSPHGGTYNCVFVVLPKPTTAPKSVVAPTTTATGTVTALLDTANGTDITDTSIAFKKSYGRNLGYLQGGEGKSVLPINTKMDSPNDGILQHPTSQTLYLQFNLPSISYVDNIVVSGSEIYDYDTYGSTDGENWYLLNSGIVSKNTFKVKGVAKHLRIVVRATDGWGATISKYVVNGYVIDENTVDEAPASAWVKEDGTKTEITSTATLPVAYATANTNYAVTGWKINTGNGFVKVSLVDIAKMDVEDIGNLYAVVEEIPVEASALTATLTAKGDDAGKTFKASKYINGFYVEGAQIRVPSGEGELAVKSGLRFVNLLDNALITKLNELKSEGTVASFEYGTVVIASTKYTGGDLVIGYNNYAKPVVGEKLFADAGDFENAYFKYTVCVTNIGEANYATDVIVRPYITINNADGTSVTLYGEQYDTSVYSAAKFALDNDANLSAEENACLQGIVDVVEG